MNQKKRLKNRIIIHRKKLDRLLRNYFACLKLDLAKKLSDAYAHELPEFE